MIRNCRSTKIWIKECDHNKVSSKIVSYDMLFWFQSVLNFNFNTRLFLLLIVTSFSLLLFQSCV